MMMSKSTISEFLQDLSAKQPTPGGGAVAGLVASIASALGNMVVAYSKGKKSLDEHNKLHDDCAQFFDAAMNEAIFLGDADAEAYEKVNVLWKLSKDDPKRITQWDDALLDAAQVPLKTMDLCKRILLSLQALGGKTNPLLDSDLAIAAILTNSAARSADWNVRINAMQVESQDAKQSLLSASKTLLDECNKLEQAIEHSCSV